VKVAKNPIFAQFEARCTFEDCKGRIIFDEAHSAGLKIGDKLQFQSSNPVYGRCPLCKRHMMQITKAPESPKPKPPVGFTKIPTE